MIKFTVISCLIALIAPSFVVHPVAMRGYSADRIHEIQELDGASRLVANPTADVIMASTVTVVASRSSAQVAAPRAKVWRCGPMVELIQGSGSAATCAWVSL